MSASALFVAHRSPSVERQEAVNVTRAIIRILILTLLPAAVAAPLTAQDPAAPALFFIERIEVRNANRVSPDVVIAESRLRERREYSEAELRDAATRLTRLPFLLSVDFALEKGSERGQHVLVLTINETKPFFYLIDAVPYFENDVRLPIDYNNDRGASRESLALGARWFVGRRGAVHLGFAGTGTDREFAREYASFAVGYTHYDLFGTRAFATLNLKRPVEGYGEGLISPQLVVGVPLSANQTVTLQYDETRFAGEDRVINGTNYPTRYGQRVLSTRWAYNTTNEPFFPTRGTLLHVTPNYGWSDGARVFSILSTGPEVIEVRYSAHHSTFYGLEAGATRYFELSDRDSVWGNVRGEWSHGTFDDSVDFNDVERTAKYGSVGGGYSHSLWSAEERANGDSRIELQARYSYRDRHQGQDFPGLDRDAVQVDAAWLRRSSWGTLRLGVGYAW